MSTHRPGRVTYCSLQAMHFPFQHIDFFQMRESPLAEQLAFDSIQTFHSKKRVLQQDIY